MRTKTYIAVLFSILLIALFLYMNNIKKVYEIDLKNLKEFQNISVSLISLKNRYENKKEHEKVLRRLKQRFRAKKFQIKGGTYLLEFDNLNENSLSSLLKIILNSDFFIQTLKITKNGKIASLYMEIGI